MSRNPQESVKEYQERRKKECGELHDSVARIIFEIDPIGINFEDNVDEYEPEVSRILPRLKEATDEKSLSRIILEVFVEMFGQDTALIKKSDVYDRMAKEIWKLI